jgi:Zn-dependent protease
MSATAEAAAVITCGGCGTEVAPLLLACPGCRRLVHAAELRTLSERAAQAAADGNAHAELEALRASLDLLPAESRQYQTIRARVDVLSQRPVAPPAPPSTGLWKGLAVLGPGALLLWKFKFVLVFLATKGKLLLLGLTKGSTFLSMLAAVGVYWTVWGLPFALGFVVAIYIHEMGHVAALRHYGIAATAPMFIPGLGAFIRLKQPTLNARESARIGLAGPIWGLGASAAAYGVSVAGGGGLWAAIGHTSAWLNLFNLLPVWQLDGGRAFSAMPKADRWIAVLAFAAAWMITHDGLVFLLILGAAARAIAGDAPAERDAGTTIRFVAVTIALAIVFTLAAPG